MGADGAKKENAANKKKWMKRIWANVLLIKFYITHHW